MCKQMFKRLTCLILVFLVSFFAVYVPPIEVDAMAITLTGAVITAAAALLVGYGLVVYDAVTLDSLSANLANRIYEAGTGVWNRFVNMANTATLMVDSAIAAITAKFLEDFDNDTLGYTKNFGRSAIDGPSSYGPEYTTTLYNLVNAGLQYYELRDFLLNTVSSFTSYNLGFYWYLVDAQNRTGDIRFLSGPGEPVSIRQFKFGGTSDTPFSNGDITTNTLMLSHVDRFYFDLELKKWVFRMKDGFIWETVFAGPARSAVRTDGTRASFFCDIVVPERPVANTYYRIIEVPAIPQVIDLSQVYDGGTFTKPITGVEDLVGVRPEQLVPSGVSPEVLNPVDTIPLFSIAALTAAGIAFTGANTYKDYWFFSKALQKGHDTASESKTWVVNVPARPDITIKEWKYYPNGIPPDKEPNKPPKWNPFKTPGEPPWKAAKEVVGSMAWYVLQWLKNKFFGDETGEGVSPDEDIAGIDEEGNIIYFILDLSDLTALPYYQFYGDVFTAYPYSDDITYIQKNGRDLIGVASSVGNDYEGFKVVKEGNDIVLYYLTTTVQLELKRVSNMIGKIHFVNDTVANVIDTPEILPPEVVIETGVDKQLELGHAQTITGPDDSTYQYIEAVAEQTGAITATIKKWMEKLIAAVQTGFGGVRDGMKDLIPPTDSASPPGNELPSDFEEDDDDENNPLRLFFVFWRLLMACIGLLIRACLFVVSLGTIAADGFLIDENIMMGINHFRNIDVYGKFTIWSAFQSVFTAVYTLMVVKIVSRNYGRL